MPIYEYACESCGHRFEKLVRLNAEPPPCPECGAGVKKLISASSFVLKGGGWYKDGYGSTSGGSGGGSSSSSGE
ncbi:MAG: zinc ribbon domain-containing protein [Deltaproteobacteria bacterium]|nr:MAG: zinc ribbon domain-containing protein [Deltaproteobacteria bacterium]